MPKTNVKHEFQTRLSNTNSKTRTSIKHQVSNTHEHQHEYQQRISKHTSNNEYQTTDTNQQIADNQ